MGWCVELEVAWGNFGFRVVMVEKFEEHFGCQKPSIAFELEMLCVSNHSALSCTERLVGVDLHAPAQGWCEHSAVKDLEDMGP